jgi:hypothetical protein
MENCIRHVLATANRNFNLDDDDDDDDNSMTLFREQTEPTERPPLVSEVSANFSGKRGVT